MVVLAIALASSDATALFFSLGSSAPSLLCAVFVQVSLTYIYGIGPTMAKKIMTNCGVENKRTKDLSEDELTKLRKEVEDGDYLIEGDLRRFTAMNIKRLIEIQCYRGKRHQMSLPVRGQKTKTNARTRKGKKKTVAGKKK